MRNLNLPDLEPATVHAPFAHLRWSQATAAIRPADAYTRPGLAVAMARGFTGRCPCCGKGGLFSAWLRQMPACTICQAPLGAVSADDAPPYFVIFLVAHVVIGTQVLADGWLDLSLVTEAAIFLPLTLILSLGLLRPVKGATIGLMLQLGMVRQDVTAP